MNIICSSGLIFYSQRDMHLFAVTIHRFRQYNTVSSPEDAIQLAGRLEKGSETAEGIQFLGHPRIADPMEVLQCLCF